MAAGDPEFREPPERHPRCALAAERGEDRRWALHEIVAGGQHLDGDAIAGERVQGQDGLDRADAATGDEDAQWVGAGERGRVMVRLTVWPALPRGIGEARAAVAGFPQAGPVVTADAGPPGRI